MIYSPGDGRILEVCSISSDEFPERRLVRIFLSVLNGHVQRAPISGKIEKVIYQKGTFLDARHPQAHLENERNTVTMSSGKGTVIMTQIAGLIARRIVCWIREGDFLKQGERYGLIRFGSQVDVLLPNDVHLLVKEGDKVVGGKTVIAKWQS
ncbi:hypothetical protein BVX98_01490 [bacterium F11]|nr:hypothetical protein BVX98_01490 [bacterium F11]